MLSPNILVVDAAELPRRSLVRVRSARPRVPLEARWHGERLALPRAERP